MATQASTAELVEALRRVGGKAEIVAGEIVVMSPTGDLPSHFLAGTRVVWDVDILREGCIRAYRATSPDVPTTFRRGEVAEAEPALPGWTFAVDDLFE